MSKLKLPKWWCNVFFFFFFLLLFYNWKVFVCCFFVCRNRKRNARRKRRTKQRAKWALVVQMFLSKKRKRWFNFNIPMCAQQIKLEKERSKRLEEGDDIELQGICCHVTRTRVCVFTFVWLSLFQAVLKRQKSLQPFKPKRLRLTWPSQTMNRRRSCALCDSTCLKSGCNMEICLYIFVKRWNLLFTI